MSCHSGTCHNPCFLSKICAINHVQSSMTTSNSFNYISIYHHEAKQKSECQQYFGVPLAHRNCWRVINLQKQPCLFILINFNTKVALQCNDNFLMFFFFNKMFSNSKPLVRLELNSLEQKSSANSCQTKSDMHTKVPALVIL